MGQEVAQNPLAGLAYLFVAGMVDPLVDALVSPEGLAALGTGMGPGEAPKEAVTGWRLAGMSIRLTCGAKGTRAPIQAAS